MLYIVAPTAPPSCSSARCSARQSAGCLYYIILYYIYYYIILYYIILYYIIYSRAYRAALILVREMLRQAFTFMRRRYARAYVHK